MTNIEKIQSMTKEEFAIFWMVYIGCGHCPINSKCSNSNDGCPENISVWLDEEYMGGK